MWTASTCSVTSTNPEHPESGADVIATKYIKDGREISRDEVIATIGESKAKSTPSTVYNIKFENIIKLGAE